MKKAVSLILVLIMSISLVPKAAFGGNSVLCFTWAWDAGCMESPQSATVVSWQGGSNSSYRGAFVVFDLPGDFEFDAKTTNVRADFSVNSAKLNNGPGQAPTAAVVLVNGDNVKSAYSADASGAAAILENEKANGVYLGTYCISSDPRENALKDISLSDYFIKNPKAGSVGIYLTNIASDGYECASGIASEMTDFTLSLSTAEDALSGIIELTEEDGSQISTVVLRGSEGDTYSVAEYAPQSFYRDGAKYVLVSVSADKISVSETPVTVTAVYKKIDENGYIYPAVRSGYSGSASDSGIFVATAGGDAAGTATKAPTVSGVSHSSGSASMASARIGVLEFEINSSTEVSSINDAVLNFYVKKVHDNLYEKWLRVGVYKTNNPYIANYSPGGMNESDYAAADGDYSSAAVYWSNEEISKSSLGWKSVNLREAIVEALDANNALSNPLDSVRVVLRLQVPTAGVYISSADEANAPYLKIVTDENALLLHYDFEELTEEGRASDVSGNGFDGLLLDDAAIRDGELVLNGNGGVRIDDEEFRKNLESYTVMTFITLDGDAVANTRVYDFGSDCNNSGFLRVKEFAVGMKYGGGATVLAGQNTGSGTPFAAGGIKYHIAVSYDAATDITKAYLNGEKITETSSITHGLNEFELSDAENYIGRTNWHNTSSAASNPDIKARYDDFRVYTQALDDRVIYSLYDPDFESKVRLAAEEIASAAARYEGSAVAENLALETEYVTGEGNVFAVKWYTSDPLVIDGEGTLFRGAEDTAVEIYAVVSSGEYSVKTRTLTITVKGLTEEEIDNSLILRYDFNDSGKTVCDSAGGYDAEASDIGVQKYGRANIDTDKIIRLPNDVNKGVTDYTVAAWVRADDLTRDGQRIYDFGIENGTASKNYYAFARLNSDGTISVGINNGGSTQTATSAQSIPEGEWAHIAVSYSEASGGTYIYINGQLDSVSRDITATMAGAVYNGHSTSNYIGRSQWYLTQSSTNPDFKGKIDNFRFYSAALSASVIGTLMKDVYNSPEIETVSAALVEGMDKAIVNISANGYEGEAVVIAVSRRGETLEAVGTEKCLIARGINSVAVSLPGMGGTASAEEVECFVWKSAESLTPLTESSAIGRVYSFSYNYEYPDNHLLSNEFSLKGYGSEEYLTLGSGVCMSEFSAGSLWTAPFEYGSNAEGYFALQNSDGTYLTLETGSVKTGKVNNWRLLQVNSEKVDGARNVYLIRQRSSGKYLARNAGSIIGSADTESENSWWVLDVKNYDTVSQMFVSAGFLSLSANERARLYGVTSQPMWQSSNRRNKLVEYMGSGYFSKSKSEQAENLRKLFSYTPSGQINRSVTLSTTGAGGVYELSDITGAANYTGKDGENLWAYKGVATYYSDAEKTEVEQTVTIYGRNANVIKNIAKGFSYIPYQYRKYIRTIKDYYHTANEFNCGDREMYVRTNYEVSAEGFAVTAAHEVGHSLSASWGTVHSSSRYNYAVSGDINKVSGYGSKNNAEDFAEFTQFAVSCSNDAELLRELKVMFPGRFAVLRAVLREMNGGECILDAVE